MPYGNVKIMGSVDIDYYAVGSGPSLSGSHVQGRALDGNQYLAAGAHFVQRRPPGHRGIRCSDCVHMQRLGNQDVNIDFRVNGQNIPFCGFVRKVELTLDGTLFAIECWADPTHDFVFASRGLGRRAPPLVPLSLSISSLGFAAGGDFLDSTSIVHLLTVRVVTGGPRLAVGER
ncbi:hypothetical protein B0H10DRAFT_2239391 [Mycena sp. CBHHK59/15]|nr:hypothetical protein B0H10DRAFT_2239391 [Mycena sp. CBHHK59/15]